MFVYLATVRIFADNIAFKNVFMKELLLVGAGGALGSMARYLVTLLFASLAVCSEWAILAVNVIGSFLIGMLVPLAGSCGYVFLAVGFCGGFTTFSTFSAQTLQLLQGGQRVAAVCYVVASVLFSLLSVLLGIYCGGKFFK